MLWQEPSLSQGSAWIENGNSPENGHFLTAVSGYEFAGIVHPWQNPYAEIDILMLRPGAPGSIIVDGDIDNRLKTLFDALSVPNKYQIPKGWAPTTDERPLHCLLHDDQLITRVNVETAQLLKPGLDSLYVQLAIRVEIRASSATLGNLSLLT
jgi:hypothetical protein